LLALHIYILKIFVELVEWKYWKWISIFGSKRNFKRIL